MSMQSNKEALHITILSSLPGRFRLEFEQPLLSTDFLAYIPGVTSYRWNPRIRTLLCTYNPEQTMELSVLKQIAGAYARQLHPYGIHVRHAEESGFALSSSSLVALSSIGLDAIAALINGSLRPVTRWLSTVTTLSSIVEHGWEELNTRGNFDPEVMSIVYLLNSLSKGTTLQASAMAWGLTFGRHLLPKDPRETEWLVYEYPDRVTLTPVRLPTTGKYAGTLLRHGLDAMARKRV